MSFNGKCRKTIEATINGINPASFPAVLCDFGCDVTFQACRENSPRTSPRYRAWFQTSSGHSDSANWPGYEAGINQGFTYTSRLESELYSLPSRPVNMLTQPVSNGRGCSQGTRHPTLNFIIQISTNVLLLSLSVTSLQLAPTMMDLTSVLARMDFLVTEKLAKVGKVISQSNFSTKFDQGLDSFATPKEHSSSPRIRDSPFPNPWNFCLWNPESWALESRIQLKESGIPLRIGIQNPDSTDKDWNQVPGIQNPQPGIQNPTLSWILLHGKILQLKSLISMT